MQKKSILFFILTLAFCCLVLNPASAQLYTAYSGSGKIEIRSLAGHHKATNTIDSGWVNIHTGDFFCRIRVAGFQFGNLPAFASKKTVVARFLSSYMDMEHYPFIIYKGTIKDFAQCVQRQQPATLQATGLLTAHGRSHQVQLPLAVSFDGDRLLLSGTCTLNLVDDYGIRATSKIRYQYLNKTQVTIQTNLSKQ